MDTDAAPLDAFLQGMFLVANLPLASGCTGRFAWVTDSPGQNVMVSDGTAWKTLTAKRLEAYSGTTDASGNFSAVFPTAYAAVPHVNPVAYPPADAITRVRVTAVSTTGFTVKTEQNTPTFLAVLGINILSAGTSNVASVPVRVLVVES